MPGLSRDNFPGVTQKLVFEMCNNINVLSQDQMLKVWDIADESPVFVAEQEMKLGLLHDVARCPDAPFVMVMGGDKRDNNLKVWDVWESAPVRARFGQRKLLNLLNTAEFGFATADEAQVKTEDRH